MLTLRPLYPVLFLESHLLHSVEQAGEKQGYRRRIEEPSELESEKDLVWAELVLVEVEEGVAIADSPNSCMRL